MRIAIYSRKSKWTGRGDSVENQILMCREYIEKKIPDSGKAEIVIYEDEGFSGKNTKRPQLQKMLADMKLRHFHYLVCYRLDRMGRNVADLALLIEKLNQEHTEFISIREQFDTSTPMGKAMLYFSGVLAQMEREQIAERVRDNMAVLARSGRWLGGNTPLGFSVVSRQIGELGEKKKQVFYLEIQEKEKRLVQSIFQEYLRTHSLGSVAELLQNCAVYTRKGKPYTAAGLRELLQNPVYCQADEEGYQYFQGIGCQMCMEQEQADGSRGFLSYGRTLSLHYRGERAEPQKWILALGQHRGMIKGRDFVKVQELLTAGRRSFGRRVQNQICLLSGVLYCACGEKMRPKYYAEAQKTKEGERKFSYRCPRRDRTKGAECQAKPIQGNQLDEMLVKRLLEDTRKRISMETLFADICLRKAQEQTEQGRAAFLCQNIQEKQREVQNLTHALAKAEGKAKLFYLEETLLKKVQELEQMEQEKKQLQEAFVKNATEKGKLLPDLEVLFSLLPVSRKREYVQGYIQRAVWREGCVEIEEGGRFQMLCSRDW